MSKRPQLPGDPSELHLHIAYNDDLRDTPHAETVERFDVAVRHGRDVHDDGRCPGAGDAGTDGQCVDGGCPALAKDGVEVGQMAFFRVHLDRGMNAFWALEEEGEDLYEFAQVLLDKDTGNFTDEVDESLAYAGGLALLIMDRVTLARPWRGRGLAAILAAEAIHRLLPGCRAVACLPGISDLGPGQQRTLDRAEWDRVTARIRTGWERVGFRHYRHDVYLVSSADEVLEQQRAVLRAELAELGAAWRKAATEDSPG
ncbi:hypothetical protein ACFYN0_01060 [Streptomyces sp. NPDC006704]|uniref:hypothetical protein n=1 Tax=Streptomyces sp. NPDC006704 TaxID=3364760 RepID=UPI0036748910